MTKQNSKSNNVASNTSGPVAGEGNLDGFTKLTTDVDFYYSPSGPQGEPIAFQGIVLEKRYREVNDDGVQKAYFIVEATRPFMVKSGTDKKFVLAQPGDHVWVDERASYARIHDMTPKRTPEGVIAFEVLYRPTAKVPLKGGRTMWKGELMAKPLSPGQHNLGAFGALATPTTAAQLPEHVGDAEFEG
jgi:hypothetical protein